MAFDFPAAPIDGEKFTDVVSGTEYIWNGVAWDLSSGGELQDYVLKAGDTVSGPLVMTGAAGIHWDTSSPVTDVADFSKGICLYGYGGASEFGFTITSGTLNYVVANVGNRHNFWCGTVNTVKIEDQGVNVTGSLDTTGHLQSTGGGVYSTGGHMYARNGSSFCFRTDDKNAWRNALNCEDCHLQYIEGGNNDGRFRIYTSNGGYSDNWVLETTIVNGAPGINVNGKVNLGSGNDYGMMVGDHWHGWAWSQTSNCEHLRSYQGVFQFLKCANTAVGEGVALAVINETGVSAQSMSANSFVDRTLLDRPELAEFIEGEDDVQADGDLVTPIKRRGVNLGKVLLKALARIDALEAELKKRR